MTRPSSEPSAVGAAASEPPKPCPRLDAALEAAIAELRARLVDTGFETIVRLHSHELVPRFLAASLGSTLDRTPPEARALLRLFELEEAVERVELVRALGAKLVDALQGAEILLPRPSGTLASRYRLEVVADDVLFAENHARRPLAVYFSEDSQFLRSVIRARPGDRGLDLCTGSGVQGLRLARDARHVDLVELNPNAVRAARLNAVLNGAADRVDVYEGDLWDALPADARYDCIVSNPPLMPVVDEMPYPLCGHGGPDGLRIVDPIVSALPERLLPGGRVAVIGACTGRPGGRSAVEALVRARVGDDFRSTLYLLSRRPLFDWVAMIASTASLFYPEVPYTKGVLRSRMAYRGLPEDTLVYTYLLEMERKRSAQRAEGERSPSGSPGAEPVRVVDYADRNLNSFWFVNRGTLAL